MIHAKKRLAIVSDCVIASKVLGICSLAEFLQNEDRSKFFFQDIKPTNLLYSAKYLEICLSQNKNDSSVLGHAALVYLFLGMSLYIRNKSDLDKKCASKSKHYAEMLYRCAEHSEQAKQVQYHYESMVKDYVQNITNMNQQ